MTDLLAQLAELAEKATRGDLSTAERHVESEWIECPWCQGSGEIEAADYCNFDSVAAGVQFYGIGPEFGAHEKLWTHFITNLPAILAMGRERDALISAVLTVVDATRTYLPPDGMDAQECLNRIIGATDNLTINPIIREAENGRN